MTLVLVDVTDRVATLTLNNPGERNTLTKPMVTEIIAAMESIEADPGVGAVVVGRSADDPGRTRCAEPDSRQWAADGHMDVS